MIECCLTTQFFGKDFLIGLEILIETPTVTCIYGWYKAQEVVCILNTITDHAKNIRSQNYIQHSIRSQYHIYLWVNQFWNVLKQCPIEGYDDSYLWCCYVDLYYIFLVHTLNLWTVWFLVINNTIMWMFNLPFATTSRSDITKITVT